MGFLASLATAAIIAATCLLLQFSQPIDNDILWGFVSIAVPAFIGFGFFFDRWSKPRDRSLLSEERFVRRFQRTSRATLAAIVVWALVAALVPGATAYAHEGEWQDRETGEYREEPTGETRTEDVYD
ncbi:hypothetical protein [Candidatus Poriferisocius sp.]|uniref:hypothetical protein n=1 Tax=Candidatus Poriferisocius sp. TaxID=3101276 RepID=UPI003B525896